jgi:hypothetical protein
MDRMPMAIAAADLSGECAESLESGGHDGRKAWLCQHIVRLIFKIISLVALVVVCVFGIAHWSVLSGIFSNRGIHGLLGLLALIVLAPAGVLFTLWRACLSAHLLLRGVPKAPERPEDAVARFLEGCLPNIHLPEWRLFRPQAESYLLLLDSAKQLAQSFGHFKTYWANFEKGMLADMPEKLQAKKLSAISSSLIHIGQLGVVQGLLILETQIQVIGYVSKRQRWLHFADEAIGEVYLRECFSLAEVGGRWYLTSPYWTEAKELPKLKALYAALKQEPLK